MKRCFKIILGITGIIILLILIDLVCIFTINRPIFSQGEDYGTYAVYKGLFLILTFVPNFLRPKSSQRGQNILVPF